MISLSNLLISNAYAEGAAPAAGGGIMDFLPLIALLAVFYFLVLRPQQKRAKDQKAMLEALSKGDEVLTTGGIMGRVTKIGETYTSIEIAENVVIQVQKETIQSVLPKGTIRSAN
ncbi:Preprotein translocase subunit YajC [Ferriphaselus amnicola]|jgi:preprotein translocase subunit YajC|uniref:Sec translocon accessory complex subunit YajC n=1 Tax=Ferriphaselus amnicola TaxID=1188319 RepID=A0A2Z6GAF2_9PROT|nr:preprotein translocase subunit YajC [Ferriphaselus amnicola]BBE50329.1 Preprotein translocase subunit YajC [Ferriphaselus amnicola]